MTTLAQLKAKALQNADVRKEYEALDAEFQLIDRLLKMRTKAGLTQEEVAERMGTKKANVSRLEKGTGNPTWETLQRYATACGCKISLDIHAM